MTVFPRTIVRIAAYVSCLVALAGPALAQTTVKVTQNESKIWTADFRATAAIVKAGTVLTVVGQRKDWFEVVVPMPGDPPGTSTGFIYKSNVARPTEAAPAAQSSAPRPSANTHTSSDRSPRIGFLGFGQFSYARFTAHNSFQAVMDQAAGQFFGGGGEVRVGGRLFVNGSVERFTQTGQRVFVEDGQVFRMGVPDTIAMTPMTATAGWRFTHERATPYVGAGVGRIRYKETSPLLEASDAIDTQFARYHVVGGVEFRNGWMASAFEVEYSRIPGAIGIGGASAAFQESDLGGVVGRIKVLVGR